MGDRPDDVLGPEGGVAAEEHLRVGRAHGLGVDLRHVPLVELDPDVALDPGESVLLADRDQHVVAGEMLVRLARAHELAATLVVAHRLHLLELDAGEAAVVVGEFLGHEVVEDRDALVHGVLLLPGGRLHFLEAGAHHHLDVLAAEAARRAAAIHGGVAAAEHDDALADLADVTERHAGQPVDADMDVAGGFPAAGNVEVAAPRRAAADEDRVKVLGEQGLEALDALAADELDAEIEDVAALLVDYRVGQAEFWDLRAHHAAGLRVGIEHHAGVAERRQVAGHGERGRAAAHQRNALAVAGRGRLGQAGADVVLVVGRHALEPADRHRLVLHAYAAARWFARTVAGAPEDSREHVGFPVDHIGVAIAAFGDQPDILGNRRVRRTRPLAIHHLVEIVRARNVRSLHLLLVTRLPTRTGRTSARRLVSFLIPGLGLLIAESGLMVLDHAGEHHCHAVIARRPGQDRPKGADLTTVAPRVTWIFRLKWLNLVSFGHHSQSFTRNREGWCT